MFVTSIAFPVIAESETIVCKICPPGNDKLPYDVQRRASTTYEYTLAPGTAWVKMKNAVEIDTVEIGASLYSIDFAPDLSYIVRIYNCENIQLKAGRLKPVP